MKLVPAVHYCAAPTLFLILQPYRPYSENGQNKNTQKKEHQRTSLMILIDFAMEYYDMS